MSGPHNEIAHIIEPARRIPVTREVDVLVVGGGLAGVTAAVAAARTGRPAWTGDRRGMTFATE